MIETGERAGTVRVERAVRYATVNDAELLLDLYLPESATPSPVVVYIHGGGWVTGDRSEGDGSRLIAMAESGVAVASIDYRLAPTSVHPAQLDDARAAVRWVRAHGETYGLATSKVAAWGASAGGYIATMLGVTHVGEAGGGESLGNVDAVVTWFSLGDMVASTRRSPLESLILPAPVEAALLGRENLDAEDSLLVAANPLTYVSKDAAKFLVSYGDRDHVVSENQGRALHDALVRSGADSTLMVVGGAGHEDPAFDADPVITMTASWIRHQLSA